MTPYPHQVDAIEQVKEKLSLFGCCYVSAQMRVGKSLIALKSLEGYRVLVLTKKNAMNGWKDTIDAICSDAIVTNYEQAHKVDSALFDAIVLDESHSKIASFPKLSVTAKKVKELCKGKKIVWLSGTPSPESFSQLFHQFYMSDNSPFRRYEDFYSWFDDYGIENSFVVDGKVIELYKDTNAHKVLSSIKPYTVSLTQQDASFICELDEETIHIEPEQMLYDMMDDLKLYGNIQIGSITIETKSKLSEMQKLHQLSGGTIKSDDISVSLSIHKIDWIVNHTKQYDKVLILVNYIQEKQMILDYLPNSSSFIEDIQYGRAKYFVGNMKAFCEGTDFSYCDAMIMYSLSFSNSTYQQARERLSHKDRETNPKIYYLHTKNSIDDLVFKAVSSKQDFTTIHYLQ